ncbi:MAG: LVIVD repeat-containing protein [Gemmatimonadota bacterium]
MTRYSLRFAAFAFSILSIGACSAATETDAPTPGMTTAAPSPDPRVGLRAGATDAGIAAWNMRLVSNTPSPQNFAGFTNSDLAFTGKYAIQGNYNGFQVWNISDPKEPALTLAYLCPASQSDVSVYRNLLFVSGEGMTGRTDCGTQGVPDTVSLERLRGIRIFDITDIARPNYIANVQTCRGSHTHTVAADPNDRNNVYIYVSGSAAVRSPSELPGCSALSPEQDPSSALFRIEVIKVPLTAPQQAAIVSSPRIFTDLPAPPRHGDVAADTAGRGERLARSGRTAAASRVRTGPSQCHDITVYPEIGLAGGACGGYGLLLDIRDIANPKRIAAAADSNFSFWHSATFSNDGSKVLFTDEWGGGRAPRCRATDKYEWGANAIFTVVNNQMTFKSYYKMPAAQTSFENCVAHNGSLIPIPGRDVMAQAWYQGGVSVFDWTDPSNPTEIAYFDRGPMDATKLVDGGSWSVYWYNGYLFSSEIARGLDIFELTPNPLLTGNEIDAARTVRFEQLNAQHQQKYSWPPSFALARAYLDQLTRSNGLAANRITAARTALTRAESRSGEQRRAALAQLAAQLDSDAQSAADGAKVRTLAAAVRGLTQT